MTDAASSILVVGSFCFSASMQTICLSLLQMPYYCLVKNWEWSFRGRGLQFVIYVFMWMSNRISIKTGNTDQSNSVKMLYLHIMLQKLTIKKVLEQKNMTFSLFMLTFIFKYPNNSDFALVFKWVSSTMSQKGVLKFHAGNFISFKIHTIKIWKHPSFSLNFDIIKVYWSMYFYNLT